MKRFLLTLVAAAIALAAMIGVEIVLALRREYLPTDPALEIGGTFGERTDPEMTFVVLGDSTAAGLGAGDPERAYATLLAKRIAAQGYRVHLVALGISGARTHDVLRAQVPLAVEARPDLVFVGIGANDVTHLTPLDEVRADASELVERLRATGADVVIAGAPDMRAAAWYEPLRSLAGWRGRAVAAAVEEGGSAAGATTVPLAERTGPYFARDPEDAYGGDDFHPGPGGYRAWADAIYPELEPLLSP
jgi:lysophospholipase L1-like esterase